MTCSNGLKLDLQLLSDSESFVMCIDSCSSTDDDVKSKESQGIYHRSVSGAASTMSTKP